MEYYVANPDTRTVLDGPFKGSHNEDTGDFVTARQKADNRWHQICQNGIPKPDGSFDRPRCVVISDAALVPNDLGNHFRLPEKEEARSEQQNQ